MMTVLAIIPTGICVVFGLFIRRMILFLRMLLVLLGQLVSKLGIRLLIEEEGEGSKLVVERGIYQNPLS
jgi:hypothetical protein